MFLCKLKNVFTLFFLTFRWTGSDTNPRNNDGEGRRGQDRSNIAQLTQQQYPEGTPGKAVPENLKNGHFGNSYPAHLNAVKFLGLARADLSTLAATALSKCCRKYI